MRSEKLSNSSNTVTFVSSMLHLNLWMILLLLHNGFTAHSSEKTTIMLQRGEKSTKRLAVLTLYQTNMQMEVLYQYPDGKAFRSLELSLPTAETSLTQLLEAKVPRNESFFREVPSMELSLLGATVSGYSNDMSKFCGGTYTELLPVVSIAHTSLE